LLKDMSKYTGPQCFPQIFEEKRLNGGLLRQPASNDEEGGVGVCMASQLSSKCWKRCMECKKLRLVAEESLLSLEAPDFADRSEGVGKWKQWLASAAGRYRPYVPEPVVDEGGEVNRTDPSVASEEGEDLDGFVCEDIERESGASSCESSDLASEEDFEPGLREFLHAQKGPHPFGDADREELEALDVTEKGKRSARASDGGVARVQPEVVCSMERGACAPDVPSRECESGEPSGGRAILFTCDMLQKEVDIVDSDVEATVRRKFVTMSCDDDEDDYEALLATSSAWGGVGAGDAVMLLRNSRDAGRPGDETWFMAHGLVKGSTQNN